MKVAAIQMSSGADFAANLVLAVEHVRAAAAEGASLVVLPEKWTAMGETDELRRAAQDLGGPAITRMRELARELRLEIVAGSIVERLPGSERLANTAVHIDACGDVRAVYRKMHMFDVEVAGRVYRESEIEDPGDEIVVSQTGEALPLGLAICYDLRFPELFRIMALRGALLIVLPSAFTEATTRDHWEALLRARAIENQVFLVAANQFGSHPGGHRSGGRSLIVDPWGLVLAQMPDRVGHVVAELDFELQADIRRRVPVLSNRRPQAYRWPACLELPDQRPEPLPG